MDIKFPLHHHLGCYDITAMLLLLGRKFILFETIGQCSNILKFKMVMRRKFKTYILFHLLKIIYCYISLVC